MNIGIVSSTSFLIKLSLFNDSNLNEIGLKLFAFFIFTTTGNVKTLSLINI